jgi:hypothetical protein
MVVVKERFSKGNNNKYEVRKSKELVITNVTITGPTSTFSLPWID